jgi:hypothetical protein
MMMMMMITMTTTMITTAVTMMTKNKTVEAADSPATLLATYRTTRHQ